MRPYLGLLALAVAVPLTASTSASAAVPRTGHFSVVDGPNDLCGVQAVYREETDYRLVSRQLGPNGDWTFTMFTDGWFSFTNVSTGRSVTVTYHKADHDLKVLASDGATRTLQTMNNRTEVLRDDAGHRLGAVHGPISFTVTVSYAGTPSDPLDDYWVVAPQSFTIHGNWKLNEDFCDVVLPALT